MKNLRLSVLLVVCVAIACKRPLKPKPVDSVFSTIPEKKSIEPGQIDEASGMADSRTIDGHLWVEEDSGNPPRINLIKNDGKLVSRISLPFPNRDWEDLGIGPGPEAGVSYLYMADIGDNNAQYSECYIYRFQEPRNGIATVNQFDKITFKYPDGPRDAEVIIVDPLTRDIFILSKREAKSRLYKLPYPQSTAETTVATYLGEIPIFAPTGGSISVDGSEIMVRTYFDVKFWHRSSGQKLDELLLKSVPQNLAVETEPQGEAVAITKTGSGFYTISEKANAASVTLNFYRKL